MRAERALLTTTVAVLASAWFAGVTAANDNSDNRVFSRVTEIREGNAIVYVYRRRTLAGAAAPIGFDVNGSVMGALGAGQYRAVAVPAGSIKVRARGVASIAFKCTVKFEQSTPKIDVIKDSELQYLGVFGGPKWETTFETQAGKEYFVELANGLRANLQTEQVAMKHKLPSLRPQRVMTVMFSKDKAQEAVRKIEKDCEAGRFNNTYQTIDVTAEFREVE